MQKSPTFHFVTDIFSLSPVLTSSCLLKPDGFSSSNLSWWVSALAPASCLSLRFLCCVSTLSLVEVFQEKGLADLSVVSVSNGGSEGQEAQTLVRPVCSLVFFQVLAVCTSGFWTGHSVVLDRTELRSLKFSSIPFIRFSSAVLKEEI